MSDTPQTDLAKLFATDPLNLTRDDISAMIQKFRQSRGQFMLGNMKAGSTKPVSAKAKQANALAEKLDLGDLGL